VGIAARGRIAVRFDPVESGEKRRIVRGERLVDLRLGPNVERALAAFLWILRQRTVRVFGGEKGAPRRGQVAAQIVENSPATPA